MTTHAAHDDMFRGAGIIFNATNGEQTVLNARFHPQQYPKFGASFRGPIQCWAHPRIKRPAVRENGVN